MSKIPKECPNCGETFMPAFWNENSAWCDNCCTSFYAGSLNIYTGNLNENEKEEKMKLNKEQQAEQNKRTKQNIFEELLALRDDYENSKADIISLSNKITHMEREHKKELKEKQDLIDSQMTDIRNWKNKLRYIKHIIQGHAIALHPNIEYDLKEIDLNNSINAFHQTSSDTVIREPELTPDEKIFIHIYESVVG